MAITFTYMSSFSRIDIIAGLISKYDIFISYVKNEKFIANAEATINYRHHIGHLYLFDQPIKCKSLLILENTETAVFIG